MPALKQCVNMIDRNYSIEDYAIRFYIQRFYIQSLSLWIQNCIGRRHFIDLRGLMSPSLLEIPNLEH